jgi:hypothetical protein
MSLNLEEEITTKLTMMSFTLNEEDTMLGGTVVNLDEAVKVVKKVFSDYYSESRKNGTKSFSLRELENTKKEIETTVNTISKLLENTQPKRFTSILSEALKVEYAKLKTIDSILNNTKVEVML